MAQIIPYQPSPERAILETLLDGLINASDARRYLDNLDFWRANYPAFPVGVWVGVSNGVTFTGNTFDQVSQQIFASDPTARPFIGYVPPPVGV